MRESDENVVRDQNAEISLLSRNSYLADLEKRFKGEPIHIRTDGPLPGRVHDANLHGIISNAAAIVFELRPKTESEARFAIANPERLISRTDTDGNPVYLEIRSLDGSVTRVWFGDAAVERDRDDLAA